MRISDWSSDVCSSDLTEAQCWIVAVGGNRHADSVDLSECVRPQIERSEIVVVDQRIEAGRQQRSRIEWTWPQEVVDARPCPGEVQRRRPILTQLRDQTGAGAIRPVRLPGLCVSLINR